MKKAIRLMCEVMMAAAFLLAVCTVGASDAMSISHGQYVAQILISVAVRRFMAAILSFRNAV